MDYSAGRRRYPYRRSWGDIRGLYPTQNGRVNIEQIIIKIIFILIPSAIPKQNKTTGSSCKK